MKLYLFWIFAKIQKIISFAHVSFLIIALSVCCIAKNLYIQFISIYKKKNVFKE